MNKLRLLCYLGLFIKICYGREPFKPRDGSLPFLGVSVSCIITSASGILIYTLISINNGYKEYIIRRKTRPRCFSRVYFSSRYRGLCIGTLVSRTAVITAAVCVTSPYSTEQDTRSINVVTGATYRHPRRGIRVQVTKILLPNLTNTSSSRSYLLQMSPAILLLKRKVPDILAEIPLRAIEIDYKGVEPLSLQEECLMAGWHYFYKGDKIYPVQRFLLQRNVRVQFLNIVKKHLWCDTLLIKFQKAVLNDGYNGHFERSPSICVRDGDRSAQPCHGMYGAPLICHGRVVALLMAPDAQWSNCTGFTNLVHLFTSKHLKRFMECVSSLFAPEYNLDWDSMKNSVYDEYVNQEVDYLPELYDKILESSSSSEEF